MVEKGMLPRVARDGLLREEARGGDHAEAAVRELLLLHGAELGRVGRLEAERIEADVSGVIRVTERPQLGPVSVRLLPAFDRAESLARRGGAAPSLSSARTHSEEKGHDGTHSAPLRHLHLSIHQKCLVLCRTSAS